MYRFRSSWLGASVAGLASLALTVVVAPPAAAAATQDFGVAMTGPGGWLVVGDEVTYQITITNTGSRRGSTSMSDTVPASLTIRRFSTIDATCSVSGSTLSCTTSRLAEGAQASVAFVAVLGERGPVENTVTLAEDGNASNNSATVYSYVKYAPLAPITISAPYSHAAAVGAATADAATGHLAVHVAPECRLIGGRDCLLGYAEMDDGTLLNGTEPRRALVTATFEVERAAVTGVDPTARVALGVYVSRNGSAFYSWRCEEELVAASTAFAEISRRTVTISCDTGIHQPDVILDIHPYVEGYRNVEGVAVDADVTVSSIKVDA